MKKLAIAISVLSLGIASSLAQAAPMEQTQKVSGFYLGGALGGTSLSATDSDYNGPGTIGKDYNYTDNMDTKDSGFKLLGGYQFNRIVAVELSYTDLGTFKSDKSSYSISPTAITAAANLGYTFQNGVRPFALAGVSSIDLSESGTKQFDGDSGVAFHYGVGVEYAPAMLKGVALRAAWESDIMSVSTPLYDDSALSLSMLSIGATYKF